MSAPRFAVGDVVRVKDDWPERRGPCHIRTPHYLRGRAGRVDAVLGAFANPEDLAFCPPGADRVLYHVLFDQPPLCTRARRATPPWSRSSNTGWNQPRRKAGRMIPANSRFRAVRRSGDRGAA